MATQLVEKVDKRAAEYVLSLSYDDFVSMFWSADELKDDGTTWDLAKYHDSVISWLEIIVTQSNEQKITYKHASQQTTGRQYVTKFGVQSLQHRLRSFLVNPYVLDVDMKNAFPTILLYLCKHYNVVHAYLEQYVNNRETILQNINLTKQDVLKCIFTDKKRSDLGKSDFIRGFQDEMVKIRDWFDKNKKQVTPDVSFSGGSKANPKGSALTRILSHFENELLMNAVNTLTERGIRVHTLMFDGMHVECGDEIIDVLNEVTHEYGVTWSIKPFDNTIAVPDDFVFDFTKCKTYSARKIIFEKNNARILEPPMFISRPNESEPYVLCNKNDFIHKNSNFTYKEQGHDIPIFNKWIEDETARTYHGIGFYPTPSLCPPNHFNTFKGFPASLTDKPADTSILHEHLRDVIAGGDETVYNYMLDTEAHIVQKPHELSLTAIVLKGEQGTGKDTEIDKVERLIGRSAVHRTSSINDMLGNFNTALKDKIVIQLNEISGATGFVNKEGIKHYITAPAYDINEKHKHPYTQLNMIRLFICSNGLVPIDLPYDDRRFLVIKVSSIWRGNTEKFNAFHAAIRDPDVMNAYYTELMNRDISKFVPKNDRPRTSAYAKMQEHCIPDLYKALRDMIEENKFTEYGGEVCGDVLYIKPTSFKNMYMEWMHNEGFPTTEFPRGKVVSRLNDMEGVSVNAKHRYSGGAPTRSYSLHLPSVHDFLKQVFK